MTGKSSRKNVDALYWQGRLRVAQAYLDAAQQAHLLAEVGQDCNPVISQIVLSAIAFGDSLTAKRAQVVNQQDHAQPPRRCGTYSGRCYPMPTRVATPSRRLTCGLIATPSDEPQVGVARPSLLTRPHRLHISIENQELTRCDWHISNILC